MPRERELHGLILQRLGAVARPNAFLDEVIDAEQFAPAPNAGGGIDGDAVLAAEPFAAFLACERGGKKAKLALVLDLLELPRFSFAQAKARAVLKQDGMRLGGLARTCALGQRHGGSLRIGRQIKAAIQHGANGDVA